MPPGDVVSRQLDELGNLLRRGGGGAGGRTLMIADQERLWRRFQSLRGRSGQGGGGGAGAGVDERAVEELRTQYVKCAARVQQRRGSVPAIAYPEELPVSQKREEILRAIREHQVVVICGETGSGKTTQIPKMCLEAGRGVVGLIGHTQPRRIAARSVGARISEELGSNLGELVGCKVRFGDQTSPRNLIKLMTDGILLAETQGDRLLQQYDTIIIDEAHERSLNIDFMLGYLRMLLPKRPDLKVIVTSATIDPERFATHFGTGVVAAPIISVSGRTFPVEVRYREPGEEGLDERDEQFQQHILEAVDELSIEGPGDILIFLSGEREIRETAEMLGRHRLADGEHAEVLPLFARLTARVQAA